VSIPNQKTCKVACGPPEALQYAIRTSPTGPTSTDGCGCIRRKEGQGWPRARRISRSASTHRDEAEILAGDADCVVYSAPTPHRMKEAIGDLAASLSAARTSSTTSLSGLVIPAARCPTRPPTRFAAQPTLAAAQTFSSGIEPGFAGRPVPDPLMSMSHTVVLSARHRDHQLLEIRERNTTCASCSVRQTTRL